MTTANPYTTTTVDSPACKQLVCGRTRDIARMLRLLQEGKSVVLFGERRIGKSLTLYLVRDIIDGSIELYQVGLWDRNLVEWLNHRRVGGASRLQTPSECYYISLHNLQERSYSGVLQCLQQIFPQIGEDSNASIVALCQSINAQARGRSVLLIDEVDDLLDSSFESSELVFRQFRSAIQSCPNISFVFAGADHWVRAIKDGTSPLSGNCSQLFLSIPDHESLRYHLLYRPLGAYIPSASEREEVCSKIINYTGGKPFYCQALAYEIANGSSFEDALHRVQIDKKPEIERFFCDPPEPGPGVLRLLAHKSKVTVEAIARSLNKSKQEVSSALDDLRSLGKIRSEGKRHSLNGKIFQIWGKANLEDPVKSTWPQRLRWLAALVFLAAAFATYAYAHPFNRVLEDAAADSSIALEMPGIVERGETGTAHLYVLAGSSTITRSVHPINGPGKLWAPEGNAWEFPRLDPGQMSEKQSAQYEISSEVRGKAVPLRLSLETGDIVEYSIPLRPVPLKAYWALVSGFAATLAVAAKWDLIVTAYKLVFPERGSDPSH